MHRYKHRTFPRVVEFEEFDHSVALAVQWMRRARVIIAPHGANLANIAFMQPGTAIFELAVAGHKHRSLMYERVARASRVHYDRAFTKGSYWGDGPITVEVKHNNDMFVQIDRLIELTKPQSRGHARAEVARMLNNARLALEP